MLEDKNKPGSDQTGAEKEGRRDIPPLNSSGRSDSFGYSAYTSPAERDYSPFSPQSLFSSPPVPENKEPPKKRKVGIARFITIGIVAFALVVVSILVTNLFTHYDFELSSGNGVIKFSLIPREHKGSSPSAPITTEPAQTDTMPTPNTTPSGEAPLNVEWDGTVLNIGGYYSSGGALSYNQIYKKCAPSVVSVYSELVGGNSSGTGIIISESGYIITNQHVISGAKNITITLESGKKHLAAIVGEDDQTDIAVLKINAQGLTAAEFADSQNVEVGDPVVVIGNPLNQTLTMTNGIISAVNRNVSFNGITMTLMQTNAALNSGNSGGPLINIYGQVIGITNMKMTSSYSSVEGIGFAIPVSTVKPVADEILRNGYVSGRPSLGVRVADISVSASIYYRLPSGVYVNSVYSVSDAYKKGIQYGDIICSINDIPIPSVYEYNSVLNKFKVGETVKLAVYRGGTYLNVDVILMDKAKLN